MKRMIPVFAILLACGNQPIESESGNGDGGSSSDSSATSTGNAEGAGGGELGEGNAGSGGSGGSIDSEPTIIAEGLTQPRLVQCDSRWIYWAEYASGDVYQGRIDSPELNTQFLALAPKAVGAAVRSEDVLYAVPEPGTIVSLPKDWSNSSVFAEAPGIRGIYAHAEDVYWYTEHDIHGRGSPVLIADETINGLAVDGEGVYFTTDSGVYSADLDGRGLSQLSNTASARAIAVDDDRVVFGTSVAVYSIARDSGTQTKIGSGSATTIAIQGDVVAWSNKNDVYIKRGDEDARMIDAVYGDGGVAICDGEAYWASPGSGYVMRADL